MKQSRLPCGQPTPEAIGPSAARPRSAPAPAGGTELTLPLGWSQRWRRRRPSWRHPDDGGFDRRRYEWGPIPHADAREFCRREHYLGVFPAAKLAIGMFEGAALVGVVVFGIPVRAAVLTGPFPDLTPYRESVELSRLVLSDRVPANGESWFLARCFEHLRRTTEIRGVVAFSDPHPRQHTDGTIAMPGHWGVVYQASGSIFLGRSRPRWLTLLPDGTVFNDRARAKILAGDQGWRYSVDRLRELGAAAPATSRPPAREWLTGALAQVGATRVRHGGNLRYAFPLDRTVRLGAPGGPYPKRDEAPRQEPLLASSSAPARTGIADPTTRASGAAQLPLWASSDSATGQQGAPGG